MQKRAGQRKSGQAGQGTAAAHVLAAGKANPVLVDITRGGTVESVHRGAIAVVEAGGRVVHSAGDIQSFIYARSAFKMMQAIPLVESGAAAHFALGGKELALACASHTGESFHVEAVKAWLAKIGCTEDDLACGPHPPYAEVDAHKLIRAGMKPSRVHNNCSGKHTGFLTLAKHLGVPIKGYEQVTHPVQRAVREALADLAQMKEEAFAVGIDGCTAPNFAMPLSALALAFAQLADPSRLAPKRAEAARALNAAAKENPLYVSGTGRACAAMIGAAKGMTTVKAGAEGVYGAVVPEKKLGIALKMDDGAGRAAECAMAAVLAQLGLVDANEPAIAKLIEGPILNTRKETVGAIRARVNL